MADSSYAPGSRAIRIPISRMKQESYTTPSRRRANRDSTMQRTESTEGASSSSEAGSSAYSSKTRDSTTLLKPSKAIASPATTSYTFLTPTQPQSAQRKDKQRASDVAPPNSVPARALQTSYSSPLSPSMLSSSSYKSINLNSHISGDDEPQRLICYTKHSQGFTWNDELFLPSYLVGRRYRGSKARRRWGDEDEDMDMGDDDLPFDEEADRCPVMDIFVTDEEAARMLP